MDAFKFDQLPDLCLRRIFAFLSLRDRMICRAVNRQFKFYADETVVDELAVSNGSALCGSNGQCNVWYLTGRAFDYGNSISWNAFSSVKSSSPKLDQQLKFLHVHLNVVTDFDFEILNAFKQLVHLEVRLATKSDARTADTTLVLPNLKVLDVHHYQKQHSYVLNTPKLEVLACKEIERVRVEHPETIKQLECDYRGVNHLAKFKNLEVLTCSCLRNDLNPISLSDWKRLKELNLSSIFGWPNPAYYRQFRSSLINLMRQRTALKRDELKLYLEDVLLVDEKQLLDYKNMARRELLFKYYQLLRRDSYPGVLDVNFNRLMELDVELSTDFFRRFPGIEFLEATGPVDRDDFEWFLENATALRSLNLENTLLDQAFMDRLPSITSQLTNLEVLESSGLVTNFNFVLQFEQLVVFETDRQLGSLDLVAQAFRQLNELATFHFRAGNECVEIWRFTPGKDEYILSFWTVSDNNKAGTQTFERKNLKFAELATVYDQRRAELAAVRVGARIKRARLE